MDYNIWSIVLSATTGFASIIAIIISLWVAHKQNRIALFEKRYEAYQIALDFFDCAYSYWKKDDRASVSISRLIELEMQIDSIIEKSKFLFNADISNILSESKECFSCHIKYYQEEPNPDRETAIKQSIEKNRIAFIEKATAFLKI